MINYMQDTISRAYTILEFNGSFEQYNKAWPEATKGQNLKNWKACREAYNKVSKYLNDSELKSCFAMVMEEF